MSTEKKSPVKRYFPDFHQSSAHQTPFMREAENGAYVEYSSYQQVLPNWISVNDHMPERRDGFMRLCLVHIKYINSFGKEIEANNYDWWDEDKDDWQESTSDEVTHWLYVDEIPAPVWLPTFQQELDEYMADNASPALSQSVPDEIDVNDPALDTLKRERAKGWNACRAVVLSASPVLSQQLTLGIIIECMQDNWNEWCADTDSFPPDFSWRGGNGVLSFEASSWAVNVARSIMKYVNLSGQAPTASELEGNP